MNVRRSLAQICIAACLAVASVACTTPPAGSGTLTATQQAISAGTKSYDLLTTAIDSTTAAVQSGLLKGQDARNALDGATKAKAGLDVMLVTLRNANAAAAASAAASGVKP